MYDYRVGDTILFKGQGPLFAIFSLLLSLIVPAWRQLAWKPWHMARAVRKVPGGWLLFDALVDGVRERFYTDEQLTARTRWYPWLKAIPSQEYFAEFIQAHDGKAYDVGIYFWTMAQYIFRHFWNRCIPRLLDDRYTCWELQDEFDDGLGEPWNAPYDCVMIVDFLQACQKKGIIGTPYKIT